MILGPQQLARLSSTTLQLLLPPTTTANAAVTTLVRGGGTAAVDVTRFRLRLEGLHTYAVITSLLMNASLRLFSATPKRWVPGQRVTNAIKVLFSIAVTISVLAGSYTTIVFSLLGLYAKRALGRGWDQPCLAFFEQTRPIREGAYDACVVSLVTFQISFCLSLFLNHDKGMDWMLAAGAGVVALACWWKWSTIMLLAETILSFGSDM